MFYIHVSWTNYARRRSYHVVSGRAIPYLHTYLSRVAAAGKAADKAAARLPAARGMDPWLMRAAPLKAFGLSVSI